MWRRARNEAARRSADASDDLVALVHRHQVAAVGGVHRCSGLLGRLPVPRPAASVSSVEPRGMQLVDQLLQLDDPLDPRPGSRPPPATAAAPRGAARCRARSSGARRRPTGRAHQPQPVVAAQGLRVHPGELGGHRDHEHRGCPVRSGGVGRIGARRAARRHGHGRLARSPSPSPPCAAEQLGPRVERLGRLRVGLQRLLRRLVQPLPARRPRTVTSRSPACRRGAARLGRAPAASGRWRYPAATFSDTGAVERGHGDRAAQHELGEGHRDRQREVVRVALGATEHRVRRDVHQHVQVAGRRTARPGSPWPASRIRCPSSTPAGMRTVSDAGRGSDPSPPHSGHGSSISRPVPRQSGQGSENANAPWLRRDQPDAVTGRAGAAASVPGRAPVPPQRWQRPGADSRSGTVGAPHRLVEVELQLALHVGTALRRGCRGAAGPRPALPNSPRAGRPARRTGAAGWPNRSLTSNLPAAAGEAPGKPPGKLPPPGKPPPPANRRARLVVLAPLLRVGEHARRPRRPP